MILQKTGFFHHRYLFLENYQRRCAAVIEQNRENSQWVSINKIMLPKYVYDHLFLFLSETRSSLGNLAPIDLIPGLEREFISDPSSLDSSTLKSLYQMDCSTVPFYDNQEGTIRDLHQLDSKYGIKNQEKADDLLQQGVSSSCEKNSVDDSQRIMDIVSPTSPSLFDNCTQKTPQFKRLQSMSTIADSSEESTIDIPMQRLSPLNEETPPITYAPAKKKLKRSDRVLFYEDDAGKKRKL